MEQSEKPTLLCLHGALGSARQLQTAMQPLMAHADLLFFDFPGHGSQASEALTIDACVDALRDYIQNNHLAGIPVFGYSMGGYAALLLAAKNPELIGPIVTLGTKLAWNAHFAAEERKKLNPAVLAQKVPKYAEALAAWHGTSWQEVVLGTAQLMADLGDKPRLNDEQYQKLQHPVMLCLATEDAMVTREETIHAAWMLPQGEFAEIANSAHPIEKVDLTNLWEVMRPFIS
jgi:pimeloyl-ACP methyl ester carboxylesterase